MNGKKHRALIDMYWSKTGLSNEKGSRACIVRDTIGITCVYERTEMDGNYSGKLKLKPEHWK